MPNPAFERDAAKARHPSLYVDAVENPLFQPDYRHKKTAWDFPAVLNSRFVVSLAVST